VSIPPATDPIRLLVDSVVDYAIFLLDETGHVLSWNPGAQRIKGYTAQEVIGQHFSIFYPEEDLAWDKPGIELKTAIEEGRVEDEGWRLRKDGSRFWASVVITALFDEDGTLRGFGKVTRDLTERRLVEERVRRSEEEFRMLVGNVLDYAIFRLDPNGYVQTWNAGAERIKGWTADEIIGKHFSIFFTQDDLDSKKPERELEVAKAEGRVEDETWRLRKDGSRFWANVVITALYDANGALRGFAKITRDLTDRRNAELAKDRFIANAAHELRTPLSVIIGLSSHLRNPNAISDPDFPELVEALSRQSTRMRTLVNNLLDLTQVAQGDRKPLTAVRLDEAVAQTLRALPPPEGKTVVTDVPDVSVRAHPARLDQVLTNLLANAYRYGGDRVNITAETAENEEILLAIADNGPGMSDELLPFLFEPFKRGAASAGIEGSGLGLAIVKGFVESFGGRIEYVPGDPGARFQIYLQRGVGA
jgi:PAS domain S-box-containing protein